MRKVIYSEWVNKAEGLSSGDVDWQLEEKGEALFQSWGCNFEEFEFGAGTFSTAIIELEDGTVKNVPTEHIKFISGEIEP